MAVPINLNLEMLRAAIKTELVEKSVPGASIAVVRLNSLPYLDAFGVVSMNKSAVVTDNTLFRLGSITKALVATLILELVSENRLDLHTPVSQYMTGLPTNVGRATLHQLLSHSSGLKSGAEVYVEQDTIRPREPVSDWNDSYSFTEPGDIYSYSTLGFTLALETAATVTKMPAQELFYQKLFQPLGMSSTTLVPFGIGGGPLSDGHYLDASGGLRILPEVRHYNGVWPLTAMLSSARDLGLFLEAFLNKGQVRGRQILHPEVIEKLSTLQSSIPGSRRAYSYGLYLREHRGVSLLEHGGSFAGYGTFLRLCKSHGVGIVVLGNRTGPILERAADAALESAGVPLLPDLEVHHQTGTEIRVPEALLYVGRYVSGDTEVELYVHESRLRGRTGAGDVDIHQIGQDRFVVSGKPYQHPIRVVRTVAASNSVYLHAEGRAYKLVEGSAQLPRSSG
jgi:CubicO group peptidase (beta-lactamase class C family)